MPDVAVVTGASRGIGAATARRLAADGYRVIACARTRADLERVAKTSPSIRAVVADVARPADVARLAEVAVAEGRIVAWINNAAQLRKKAFDRLELDEWRALMGANLDSVFLGCRAAYDAMASSGGGVIVNIASLSGVQNVEKFPGLTAYNVAKAGVIALSEAVALEGREHGVRCTCVSFGAVETAMLHEANPSLRARMTPDDAATVIAWLVTPAAAPLSGTNIPIFSNG